jgi:hypothetical protein
MNPDSINDSYELQTLKSPNPLTRFAHHVRYKNSLGLVNAYAKNGATILDFGAGEGELLHQLGASRPDLRMFAFEPFENIAYPEIQRHTSIDDVASNSIDVLSAFETFEHLTPDYVDQFILQARRICKADAKLIVSVPIMQGVALPIKEASRAILLRRFSDYSLVELIRGTCGLKVDRTADILYSHKGFDQRTLFRRLDLEFQTVNRFFCPIRALPWWCNSQAFFVFAL